MIAKLFQSGWWVAVAALIAVAGILALVVRPGSISRQGDGRDPSTYGFDLSCLQVSGIVAGGMGRDGLHAIDDPETVAGTRVATINEEHRGKLLVGSDRVIGVFINGQARAYPLRLLRWHEVVNDVLGGEPIAVTYSGLSDASAVWRRPLNDNKPMMFGVSGLLFNSNTLIYDRGTTRHESSLWSQLSGHSVSGPLACWKAQLDGVPFDLTMWSDWLNRHPETDVMAPLPEFKRLYKRDPYHSYFGSQSLHFPVDPMPPQNGPNPKERVVVIDAGSQRKVFTLSTLDAETGAGQGSIESTIDGIPVRIHFTTQPPTVRVESAGDPSPRPLSRVAFWFAWHAQFPDDPLATP